MAKQDVIQQLAEMGVSHNKMRISQFPGDVLETLYENQYTRLDCDVCWASILIARKTVFLTAGLQMSDLCARCRDYIGKQVGAGPLPREG
jgi:uncharacterized protein